MDRILEGIEKGKSWLRWKYWGLVFLKLKFIENKVGEIFDGNLVCDGHVCF